MIHKTHNAGSFKEPLDYTLTKQKAELITTNMGGSTPDELAQEFNAIAQLRTRYNSPCTHVKFSLPHRDTEHPQGEYHEQVDNDTAVQMIQLWMKGMGFLKFTGAELEEEIKRYQDDKNLATADCQYVIVRHNDTNHDHFHLIVNRIALDGAVVNNSWDYYRGQIIIRKLEQDFNLEPTKCSNTTIADILKEQGITVQVNETGRSEETQREKYHTSGEISKRRQLQNTIDEITQDHPTVTQFINRLQNKGINPKPVFTSQGKFREALAYELEGVHFAGYKLGKAYSFPGLIKHRGVNYNPVRDLSALIAASKGEKVGDATASLSLQNQIESTIKTQSEEETQSTLQQQYQIESTVKTQSEEVQTILQPQTQIELSINNQSEEAQATLQQQHQISSSVPTQSEEETQSTLQQQIEAEAQQPFSNTPVTIETDITTDINSNQETPPQFTNTPVTVETITTDINSNTESQQPFSNKPVTVETDITTDINSNAEAQTLLSNTSITIETVTTDINSNQETPPQFTNTPVTIETDITTDINNNQENERQQQPTESTDFTEQLQLITERIRSSSQRAIELGQTLRTTNTNPERELTDITGNSTKNRTVRTNNNSTPDNSEPATTSHTNIPTSNQEAERLRRELQELENRAGKIGRKPRKTVKSPITIIGELAGKFKQTIKQFTEQILGLTENTDQPQIFSSESMAQRRSNNQTHRTIQERLDYPNIYESNDLGTEQNLPTQQQHPSRHLNQNQQQRNKTKSTREKTLEINPHSRTQSEHHHTAEEVPTQPSPKPTTRQTAKNSPSKRTKPSQPAQITQSTKLNQTAQNQQSKSIKPSQPAQIPQSLSKDSVSKIIHTLAETLNNYGRESNNEKTFNNSYYEIKQTSAFETYGWRHNLTVTAKDGRGIILTLKRQNPNPLHADIIENHLTQKDQKQFEEMQTGLDYYKQVRQLYLDALTVVETYKGKFGHGTIEGQNYRIVSNQETLQIIAKNSRGEILNHPNNSYSPRAALTAQANFTQQDVDFFRHLALQIEQHKQWLEEQAKKQQKEREKGFSL